MHTETELGHVDSPRATELQKAQGKYTERMLKIDSQTEGVQPMQEAPGQSGRHRQLH